MASNAKDVRIKCWISGGEGEKFEKCLDARELLDSITGELGRLFNEGIGDTIFVDQGGTVWQAEFVPFGIRDGEMFHWMRVVLRKQPESNHVVMLTDADVEIITDPVCENCLSENINELGICSDCGHITPQDGHKNPPPRLKSSKSH